MQSNSSYPESFDCPITNQMMEDPVMDPEGNSYERSAIMAWLTTKKESPITRSYLDVHQLKTNRALRDAIDQFKKNQMSTASTVNHTVTVNATQNQISTASPLADFSNMHLSLNLETNLNDSMITIKSPESTVRASTDICCVIDVSGSMGTEAIIKTSAGREGFNLSLLDIVKHAVRTIKKSLGQNDRLALITYSNNAHVVLNLTSMDTVG